MPRRVPPDERLISTEEAAVQLGRGKRTLERWIQKGYLQPYKRRGDRRTHVDVDELPEAVHRAGRPGPKPRLQRRRSDT